MGCQRRVCAITLGPYPKEGIADRHSILQSFWLSKAFDRGKSTAAFRVLLTTRSPKTYSNCWPLVSQTIGLNCHADPKVRHAEALLKRRRAQITQRFLSGEWVVELESYEANQERQRQRDQEFAPLPCCSTPASG